MRILYTECGLGNQMFQYAYVKYLESKGHPEVWIDSSAPSMHKHQGFELRRIFPAINSRKRFVPFIVGWVLHLLCDIPKKVFGFPLETEGEGDNHLILPSHRFWLRGYWQKAYFAEQVRPELLSDFAFSRIDDPRNQSLAEEMQQCNSIALHIRGGDYLLAKNQSTFANIATKEYYQRAVKLIQEKVDAPRFYLFTNDIEYSKQILPDIEVTFVDHNREKNSFRDMQLMSLCRHNIIANSSFSWWGAWLNQNTEKLVIAPSKWFHTTDETFCRNLIPQSWIRL